MTASPTPATPAPVPSPTPASAPATPPPAPATPGPADAGLPALEWVTWSPMTTMTNRYVGGVLAGHNYLFYFRVTGGPGEVRITAEIEGREKTITAPVEEGKLYELVVELLKSGSERRVEETLVLNSPWSPTARTMRITADNPGQYFYLVSLGELTVHEYVPTPEPAGPSAGDIQEIIDRLADPDAKTRQEAARELGRLGADAHAAIPALIQVLGADDSYDVRISTAVALGTVGSGVREAALALIDALRTDSSFIVRAAAAGSLGKLGAQEPEIVPALIEALGSLAAYVPSSAAGALGAIGPDAREAVPTLIDFMLNEGRFSYDSGFAADALGKIGPDAREAVPALITALRSDHPYTGLRTSAAAALGKIGPDAREAVPALIDTLDGASYYLLLATAEALTQLTGQDFGDDAPAWRRWWDQAQP